MPLLCQYSTRNTLRFQEHLKRKSGNFYYGSQLHIALYQHVVIIITTGEHSEMQFEHKFYRVFIGNSIVTFHKTKDF